MYDTLPVATHPTGPGHWWVTVAGDLDVVTPDVREALKAAHDRVDVDCGGLTFCDCTGLSALLAAAHAAKASGSELRLYSVPHPPSAAADPRRQRLHTSLGASGVGGNQQAVARP